MSVDGAHLEYLTSFGAFANPFWIGGGEQIIFSYFTSFYQMDADGSQPEWLFNLPESDSGNVDDIHRIMQISDKELIVIAVGRQHQIASLPTWQTVFRVDVGTGEVIQLTPFGELMWNSVLTNDKEWLVYVAEVDGNKIIYRMHVDGSNQERLFEFSHAIDFITYENTPDGRWVIATYRQQGTTSRPFKRVRFNMEDGTAERLPDGSVPLASPLIDLDWEFWVLTIMGGVLMVISAGMGYWERKR